MCKYTDADKRVEMLPKKFDTTRTERVYEGSQDVSIKLSEQIRKQILNQIQYNLSVCWMAGE